MWVSLFWFSYIQGWPQTCYIAENDLKCLAFPTLEWQSRDHYVAPCMPGMNQLCMFSYKFEFNWSLLPVERPCKYTFSNVDRSINTHWPICSWLHFEVSCPHPVETSQQFFSETLLLVFISRAEIPIEEFRIQYTHTSFNFKDNFSPWPSSSTSRNIPQGNMVPKMHA